MAGGLLAIFAHPDDETFGVGGTMAHYAARGVPVTMICATRGEAGEIAPGTGATPDTLGQVREQELRDACAVLGVSDVRFLDFRDSGMAGTPENEDPRSLHMAPAASVVEPLVRAIRELRPAVIATWDPSGGYGHPDHIAVHRHATAAFHAATDPAHLADAGEPWRTDGLFYVAFPLDELAAVFEEMRSLGLEAPDIGVDEETIAALDHLKPNCVVDVSAQYERKQRAFAAHRTQISEDGPFRRMPEHLQRRFFGREYFHRAAPPVPGGNVLNDLFDGLAHR